MPKLHILDSGVLAASRGLSLARLKAVRSAFGALVESFVFAEIMKLMAWPLFATKRGAKSTSFSSAMTVLERDDGAIAGIEVKASATVTAGDLSGLKKLVEAAKDRFAFGVVLYDGDNDRPVRRKTCGSTHFLPVAVGQSSGSNGSNLRVGFGQRTPGPTRQSSPAYAKKASADRSEMSYCG